MSDLKTPDAIIAELVHIRAEADRGVEYQYKAEMKVAEATLAAETAEAKALLEAQGTVVDRQAVAKIKSESERFALAVAKAELNRVRTKLKLLTEAQMSVQTQARMVEMMYKTAGLGER